MRLGVYSSPGAYFEGTVNPRCSLIVAHLRNLWALSIRDLYLWQRAMAFICTLRTLLRNGRDLMLQKTNTRRMSTRNRLTNWSLDEQKIVLNTKFEDKLRVCAVCEARPLGTPAFIWSLALISYLSVKPSAFKRVPAFIQVRHLFICNVLYGD